MSAFFAMTVLGNTVLQWGVALLLLVGLQCAFLVTRRQLLRRFASSESQIGSAVALIAGKLQPMLIFTLIFCLAASSLVLPKNVGGWPQGLFVVALLLQVGVLLSALITRALVIVLKERGDPSSAGALSLLSLLARLLLWSALVLVALQNLGFDVTALIAGLGIGGVAIALAVQNILGDLFASLAIILDKPFQIGDFIVVGNTMGTVEYIGIKTTRLRSLSGEQLIVANSDLLGSRISNFKRMAERRVLFRFGVTYDTPLPVLREVPARVGEFIGTIGRVRLDRVHFASLGAYSLDFEVVYFVLSPDFNTYMDIHQSILFGLMEQMREMKVNFAFPTQELLVKVAKSGAAAEGGSAEARLESAESASALSAPTSRNEIS